MIHVAMLLVVNYALLHSVVLEHAVKIARLTINCDVCNMCMVSCNQLQFKPYGTICRSDSNECGLSEYCTGDNAEVSSHLNSIIEYGLVLCTVPI